MQLTALPQDVCKRRCSSQRQLHTRQNGVCFGARQSWRWACCLADVQRPPCDVQAAGVHCRRECGLQSPPQHQPMLPAQPCCHLTSRGRHIIVRSNSTCPAAATRKHAERTVCHRSPAELPRRTPGQHRKVRQKVVRHPRRGRIQRRPGGMRPGLYRRRSRLAAQHVLQASTACCWVPHVSSIA